MRLAHGLLSLLLCSVVSAPSSSPDATVVQPNDNRHPAGTLVQGVLHLDLEVRLARWYPEADDGPSLLVPVFAEAGQAPSIPGPLIRVPTGTIIEARIANRLGDSTITVQGFLTRPAAARDSLRIPPGEVRTVRFAAGDPGTYWYKARAGHLSDDTEAEQLAGAFIVDPPGRVRSDRIFVINIWGEMADSVTWRNALAINGKSWPYTERLHFAVGDSVRWRIVNPSVREHPMHLHGFYYRVGSVGTMTADTLYPPADRRLVVTEDLLPGHTMTMAWSPQRPGNWLFHCHLGYHVIPEAARYDTGGQVVSHDHDHMAGLVLGLEVRATAAWKAPARVNPVRLGMRIEELAPHGDSMRTIGVAIGEPGHEGPLRSPGPLLLAERGRPLDVTVINHLAQSTAIHWHGLELLSYWDGVAGWSGGGPRVALPIAAGDSFVAHLDVPRAGTFIYHTHLNDLRQITAGLYGPLVVLERGAVFDSTRDHIFTIGWDGEARNRNPIVVNGSSGEPPLEVAAGVPQRLRFINIGVAARLLIELRRDGTVARWQVVAVDGADLPASQRQERPASRVLDVGMTFDAIFTPAAGEYTVQLPVDDTTVMYRRRLIAR
jgi:FtsP/CotA-like multicopper oxidase with cupredoxin domain